MKPTLIFVSTILVGLFFGTGSEQAPGLPLQTKTVSQISTDSTVYYIDLAAEPIIPIDKQALRKEGALLRLTRLEARSLTNVLQTGAQRSFADMQDVRMEIVSKGVPSIFVGPNGTVTQGGSSWSLSPKSFLQLYLFMSGIEKRTKGPRAE